MPQSAGSGCLGKDSYFQAGGNRLLLSPVFGHRSRRIVHDVCITEPVGTPFTAVVKSPENQVWRGFASISPEQRWGSAKIKHRRGLQAIRGVRPRQAP